jgi:hypothetical protein
MSRVGKVVPDYGSFFQETMGEEVTSLVTLFTVLLLKASESNNKIPTLQIVSSRLKMETVNEWFNCFSKGV